jgi:hypothetical protein
MIWFFIILCVAISAIIVTVFVHNDQAGDEKTMRCVHCEKETYLLRKNICTSCHKNLDGHEMSEQDVLTLTGKSPGDLEKKKRMNRIFIWLFSILAIAALIFTLLKMLK